MSAAGGVDATAALKARAAYVSIASNLSLVVGKVAVGLLMSSVAIMSEAVHSGIDLLAAGLAAYAVRQSAKPPDGDHAYGHGKFEDVSGTVEAALIFLAAVIIVYESAERLKEGGDVELPLLGVAVMGASAAVNMVVSSYLLKVARATESVALEADALHLRTDVWTSLGVTGAMGAIYISGWTFIDPAVAIAVAFLIGWAAVKLTRRTLGDLVDAPLPREEVEVIKEVLDDHRETHFGYDSLRTRRAGPDKHIDLHLHFPPETTLEVAHESAHRVQAEIEERLPRSQVLIHIEPCPGDCAVCQEEGCSEREEAGGEGGGGGGGEGEGAD